MGRTCPGQVLACLSYQKIRGELFSPFILEREKRSVLLFWFLLKLFGFLGFFKPLENKRLLDWFVFKTAAGLTSASLPRIKGAFAGSSYA